MPLDISVRVQRDPASGVYITSERYTHRVVNGFDVLFQGDALAAFEWRGQPDDYGILIKVSDTASVATRLEAQKHLSIGVLYSTPRQRLARSVRSRLECKMNEPNPLTDRSGSALATEAPRHRGEAQNELVCN